MAMPGPGLCLILLVFALVLYKGCAFRIRDAVPFTTLEQSSRSSVCVGQIKCMDDGSRMELSLDYLPARMRRRYDVESSAVREQTAGKIRQLPVVDEISQIQDDTRDTRTHIEKTWMPLSSAEKWTGTKSKKVKINHLTDKGDYEEKDENELDIVTEEDDDDVKEIDADRDNDGVEISNGDESSEENNEELINADDEDNSNNNDEYDRKNNDDKNKIDQVSNQNSDNNEEDSENGQNKANSDDPKDDTDDDNGIIVKKFIKRDATSKILRSKNHANKFNKDVDQVFTKKNVNRGEPRRIIREKITTINDEETDSEKNERSKRRRGNVRDIKHETASVSARKMVGKNKVTKKINVKRIDEDDDNDDDADEDGVEVDDDIEDDDDEDDDDKDDDNNEEEVSSVSVKPAPLRKLEKVRLADKEKSKSIETIPTIKLSFTEPEKIVKSMVKRKSKDGTKVKKKEDIEDMAKVEIFEKQETNFKKLETSMKKPEMSSKKMEMSMKNTSLLKSSLNATTSNVKSEVLKKSTKGTVKSKAESDERIIVAKTKIDRSASGQAVQKSEISKLIGDSKKSGKRIDDAVEKDKKNLDKSKKRLNVTISLTKLNDAILRVPTFVPNFTAIEDSVCQQHGKIFLRQLRGYKLWALQMLDASAKIPSGLLRGNINQFGDFDQCLGITARVKVGNKTVKIQGKYCLATLDIHATIPDMKVPVNFMQSRGFIRASMRDPGHFVPRFTTANWAICLPAACSAENAQATIENALSDYSFLSGLRFTIEVDPEMCYVRQKSQTYSKETIGVLYFYAMIICVIFIATVRDYIVSPQGKGNYSERIIMSFSLRRTLKILTREENKSGSEISCIHGIRSLATIALYVAHKIIPTSQIPYVNRIVFTEIANNPMSSLLRASVAYTDCFLLLSGLLTAFNMARESTKRGEIRWFCRFIARFIRLTPSLLVMVFWYAYVMEHTGSGPQWHRVITMNAKLCKENSWTNLLYIQNFFPFEEMCATHTHQLALDMQLSLITPILVFLLTLKPIIGIVVIFFIIQVSATMRYFATTNNYLSLVIFHGMTMKQLYRTANLTYVLPLHRATSYVFGIGLGVLLHYTGKNVRIYRIFVIVGWSLATFLGVWSLLSPWQMARRDYVYDVEEAAHYAVIAPVTWSLSLCWIIFACFTDHGGVINKFLSSYCMILFSRISYAVYLCQFAIFFYNVGSTRYSSELQIQKFIDPYEAIATVLVSIVLTLFIDVPMQEAKNIIMESTDFPSLPIIDERKKETEELSSLKKKEIKIFEQTSMEKPEGDEENDSKRSWDGQDDAIDGLMNLKDSYDDENAERWRLRPSINVQRYSSVKSERYEDEKDEELKEEKEEEEEEEDDERQTEWSWVHRTAGKILVEDDGLLENQRDQTFFIEPEIRYQYPRDDEKRREKRSLLRQSVDQSPRSSVKRERSSFRQSETRNYYPKTENYSTKRKQECSSIPPSEILRRERTPQRDRSVSRTSDSRIPEMENITRHYSKSDFDAYESDGGPSRENSRYAHSPSRALITPKGEIVKPLPSEREEKTSQHRQQTKSLKIIGKQPIEPKVSDEEVWEQELRIRRRKLMERLASEDRDLKLDEGNDGWNSTKRRSSAEGKLALLKDPIGSNVMDSWTVSREPRVSLLGSSQETEDDSVGPRTPKERLEIQWSSKEYDRSEEEEEEKENSTRKSSYTSDSQVTSVEEEDYVTKNNFALNKDSKRTSVMDLSKLMQQDESMKDEEAKEEERPITTPKLFKRESIVKSQASEEDPEYLLPERPKLIEQEQDHPFKKAWQLQKSRSEEDPTAYSLKEVKGQQDLSRVRTKIDKDNQDTEKLSKSNQSSFLDCFKDDMKVTSAERSFDHNDRSQTSKSTNDDSPKVESLSENERDNFGETRQGRKSD